MLLPTERYMINQDVRLYRESVTVGWNDDYIKGLLIIMTMDDSVDVRTAIYPHGAEANKLTALFPNSSYLDRYKGMSDELRDKLLN